MKSYKVTLFIINHDSRKGCSQAGSLTRHYKKLILSGADGTVYNALSSNQHNNKFNNGSD